MYHVINFLGNNSATRANGEIVEKIVVATQLAVFRSSLVEKPNLALVSKYSTFLRNQKGKIKEIFAGKLCILTLRELLEYITSKPENVGNFFTISTPFSSSLF